jgi:hypothetical protein
VTISSEQSADTRFEIGHVLFIDIVGYSKLLINEQSEEIRTLREIVRGTEQFPLAEAQGKLVMKKKKLSIGWKKLVSSRTAPAGI